MHEKIRLLVAAKAERAAKSHKILIDSDLNTLRGVFKGGFLIDWCERDLFVLKKKHHDSKKKIQRKEETFSQVINNP